MALRMCADCGKPFNPDEDWKSTCILCWKRSRGYELNKSDRSFERLQQSFSAARDAWKDRQDGFKKDLGEVQHKLGRCERALLASRKRVAALAKRQPPPPTPPAGIEIGKKRLRQLLLLCHPDKHKGHATSLDVTKWLLDLRQRG